MPNLQGVAVQTRSEQRLRPCLLPLVSAQGLWPAPPLVCCRFVATVLFVATAA